MFEKEIILMKGVKEVEHFLISKLKLIKNNLRSTMAQERLSSLSLLSIGNQRARGIDINKVIDKFASMKSRIKKVSRVKVYRHL